VVLADASRKPLNISETAFLSEEIGLAFKMDPDPLLYRLAKVLDNQQDNAEDDRVLYVALTRAQEKLIINGHVTFSEKKGWSAASWLNELSFAADVDVDDIIGQAGEEVITKINSGQEIRAWALPNVSVMVKEEGRRKNEPPPDGDNQPIYAPLNQNTELKESEDEPREKNDWRATGSKESIPPGVVGHMVHKAIELWMFPGNPRLTPLLESAVLDAGLAQPSQRVTAIDRTGVLLTRLRNHPIWEEIESATEVYHELPYSRLVEEYTETGYVDLLYCSSGEWQIIDFKTDSILSAEERSDLIDKYSRQVRRYASAVETLMGQMVQQRICFLDDHGRVELVKV
jgi:ATP-dependent exoDNAse (exonuclease V) beta subunit